MSTAYDDLFRIYQVRLGGAPGLTIDGISTAGVNPGAERDHYRGAGRVYPTVSTLVNARRDVDFATISLASVLGITGVLLGPVKIVSGGTYTSGEIIEARYEDLGGLAAGSVHRKNVISRGLLLLKTLSASQGDDGKISPANASMGITPITDGTNDPLTVSVSQALPAATAETEYFALGPVYIESIKQNLVSGWSLNLGIAIDTAHEPGGLYPRAAYMVEMKPTLTINYKSPKPLSDFGASGTALSGTIILYLVKCDATGARIAGATAAHIAITINHGTITPQRVSGSLGSNVANSLLVEILDDTVNPIISVATTATLP